MYWLELLTEELGYLIFEMQCRMVDFHLEHEGIIFNVMDKRKRLVTDPFTYRSTKDGKLIVYRGAKQVKIVSGKKAINFIFLAQSADEVTIQQALARLTGHYRQGSE